MEGFGLLRFIVAIIFLIVMVVRSLEARRKNVDAEQLYGSLLSRVTPDPPKFYLNMVADLPAVAQSYFRHAIAPGAYLQTGMEVQMTGRCAMGGPGWPRRQKLSAKAVLRRPSEYVWLARTHTPLSTSWRGLDVSVGGDAWTTFDWGGIEDLTPPRQRILLGRRFAELLWVPAGLLPECGARWQELDAMRALVTTKVRDITCVVELTFSGDGSVRMLEVRDWGGFNADSVNGQLTVRASGEQWYGDFQAPSRLACSMLHHGREFEFLELNVKYMRPR